MNPTNNVELLGLRAEFEERASKPFKSMPKVTKPITEIDLEEYRVDMAAIAESILNFKDGYYSLEEYPFWIDIFNSPRLTLEVEPVYRNMVLKCSRQIGKSVFCGAIGTVMSITRNSFNTIICHPTDKQVSVFSAEILKRFNLDSVVTDVWYRDPRKTVRQVKNYGYLSGSRILLANIYNSVLSARGASGDLIIIDESQAIPTSHAAIIESCAQRSKYRTIIHSGTPNSPLNPLQVKFDASTQHEWMVPCMHCGHWNGPLGGDGKDKKIKNIGKTGLICDKCGFRIYPEDGEWVAAYPDKEVAGYHINELMVSSINWPRLLFDLKTRDEVLIWNELLGISYSGEAFPIPFELMVKHCDPSRFLVEYDADVPMGIGDYMFAGIDWGGETAKLRQKDKIKSFTMLTISKYDIARNKIVVVFIRRYFELPDFDSDSPNEVLTDIIHWLNVFHVNVVGCDYGIGHKENQRIADAIGIERMMEMQYLGDTIEFYEYLITSNKFIINRSKAIEDFIEALKMGEYEFPRLEEISEYISDVTGLYKYNDILNRVIYGNNGTDDWMHTLIYILLAMRYYFNDERFVYVKKA